MIEKTKLIDARKSKGFTQQQIAEKLHIDISNYNRREKGLAKISMDEWEKLSKILDLPLEEIYQNEEYMTFICKDNATGNYQGNNVIYTIPESLLETQRKYIHKLEEENKFLKEKIGKK